MTFLEKLFGLKGYESISNRTRKLFELIHHVILRDQVLQDNIQELRQELSIRDEFVEQQLSRLELQ